jgi:hypothetical protein
MEPRGFNYGDVREGERYIPGTVSGEPCNEGIRLDARISKLQFHTVSLNDSDAPRLPFFE